MFIDVSLATQVVTLELAVIGVLLSTFVGRAPEA
jgi:hypothetical protein